LVIVLLTGNCITQELTFAALCTMGDYVLVKETEDPRYFLIIRGRVL